MIAAIIDWLYWTPRRAVVRDLASSLGIYAKPEWSRRRTYAYCRDMLLLLDSEATADRWPCGCKANTHGCHAIGCAHPVPPEWSRGD